MEYLEITLKYLTPLVGVIIGALMNQLYTSRRLADKTREERFFDVYEHFYSDEMIEVRRAADKHLLDNKEKSFEFCIGYDSGEGALALSRILHSFQRLAVACDTGQIDSELAKSYMQGQLRYWYTTHLYRFKAKMQERGEFLHILQLAEQWGIA